MSRTDKDVPYWVAARWYEPVHVGCEFDEYRPRWGRRRECDLPATAVRQRPVRVSWRGQRARRCYWGPFWDGDLERRYGHGTSAAPRWFVRHHYHDPMRTDGRDVLRAAAKDYRANGETDIEPVNRPGRHSAAWDYW